MPSAPLEPMLRGRRDECAVLDRLLEGARGGRSGVLVLKGEAGVGKTALLEHAVGSASDMRGIRAAGVQSEMELAFAALHQLCMPLLEWLERLPGPQRDALATTFGLSEGAVPDRFFVGLATLGLLSEAAEERPLVCVVDDAQWLDRASAQVLAFVGRRLGAEPVVMLFGVREPSEEFAGLPKLVVEGLSDRAARDLLASVIAGRLDERVADQIVTETRGNPLALLELPRGLSSAQLAGGFGLPGALSLEGRIEESFQQRLEALPEDTQRLLLVAAAEPGGDPTLVWRAAERLSITGTALEPAELTGLIEIDGSVRFRHPLVRSAVYRAASAQQRRRVHRALADMTDAETDPDRRAWHLAEATAGPEESVAAELERAAGRAQARGGLAAAAAFLERAAALTPEPASRAQRALAAAQTKYEAGALDDALTLLATAESGALGDLERARVDLLRAQIAFASRRGSDAPPLLLKAARELEAVDPDLARATYLEALAAARFAGPLGRGAGVVEVSEAALAGPQPPQPPRPPDLLLQGLAVLFTEGYAAGPPILKEALSAFRRETVLPPREARWLPLACQAAADVWDDVTWRLLSTRELERARDTGALTAMPLVLSTLSYIHAISGELAAAEALLDEIKAATEATGIPSHRYVALWIAALRGREAELSELIDTTASEAVARGEGFALAITEQVSAVLNNGLGRYDVALAAVRQAVEVDLSSEMGSPRAVAELIEAAVRCGEHPLAERALERLAVTTRASGTDWALGVEARSRALLSDGDRCRQRSIARRSNDWDARASACSSPAPTSSTANGCGANVAGSTPASSCAPRSRCSRAWAPRRSPRAPSASCWRPANTSENATPRPSDELTPQEAQIARLAREGLSNAEIGARLFVSQHTVAYHLRKVFSKLDITSRSQLRRALPDRADAGRVA